MWRSPPEDKDPVELPLFDFNSILVATDNFREKNKLGQGGYGPVYKVCADICVKAKMF